MIFPFPTFIEKRTDRDRNLALTALSSRHGPTDQEARCPRHTTSGKPLSGSGGSGYRELSGGQ